MSLSRPMLACLARCRRAARFLYPGNETRIFPPASSSGHISEWKQPDEVGKTPRKTYATIAYEVTGEEKAVGVMLNHSQQSVTPLHQLRRVAWRLREGAGGD